MTVLINFASNIIDEETEINAWVTFEDSNGKSIHRLGSIGIVRLPKWLFTCISIDTSTGFIDFRSNDITVVKNKYIENAKNPTNFPKSFTQYIRLGEVNPGKIFLSSIGNLNIFSGETDFDLLNCSSVGDYLSWSDITWNMKSGVALDQFVVKTDPGVFCGQNNKLNVILDAPVPLGDALYISIFKYV